MAKYTFDAERINYSRVNNNLKGRLLRGIVFLTAGFTIAILLNVLYSVFFDTPYERQLRQENKSLIHDYSFLSRRFNQIDTVLKSLKKHDENIYRMIFEAEPVRRSGITLSEGDSRSVFRFMEMGNEALVFETKFLLGDIFRDVSLNSAEYRNLFELANRKQEMLQCIPAIQPIANKELIRAASGYGYRIHPIYKIRKFHSGMDFTAPTGTPVFATGDGMIEEVNNTGRGSGNTIVVDHGFGYKTKYSHLEGFNVKRGRKVKRGNVIGWVGNTGLSVAPHLHYEVLLNGQTVNPVNYYFLELSPEEYDKMIELSIKSGQSFD